MENFIFCVVPYPFVFGKNRKHSKEIYDCFEQGKMVIEQSDHNYCKIFPRITKYRDRYSVQDSKRCRRMEVKSQYIPKDLQIQRKTGDRSFFFANLTPITHFYFIETGPLKPRERCFPNFLDQQKEICLSPILSNGSGIKNNSIGSSKTDSRNPSKAETVLVSLASANVNKESLVTSNTA